MIAHDVLVGKWALVQVGAATYLGHLDFDTAGVATSLEPVFEARVVYQFDAQGNFIINRQCLPVLGSPSIRRLDLPETAIIHRCSALSKQEADRWSRAATLAEGMIEALRFQDSGLAVAPANVLDQLPPASKLLVTK